VARALDGAWNGSDTLVVVSSDLSHYHTSEKRDSSTTCRRTPSSSGAATCRTSSCGARAINGLMQVAPPARLVVELLDQRNSGDTAGDRSRVVGYGSYAIYET